MLTEKNSNSSINAIVNKFFGKTILQNMFLLCNNKKTFLLVIESTLYSNYYLTIGSYPIVCYIVKYFIKQIIFYE